VAAGGDGFAGGAALGSTMTTAPAAFGAAASDAHQASPAFPAGPSSRRTTTADGCAAAAAAEEGRRTRTRGLSTSTLGASAKLAVAARHAATAHAFRIGPSLPLVPDGAAMLYRGRGAARPHARERNGIPASRKDRPAGVPARPGLRELRRHRVRARVLRQG